VAQRRDMFTPLDASPHRVPALNEESGLPPLLSELRAVAERDGFSAEIVVIDDASTDRTAEVAREHGARVVRLCRNLGIGGAVQTGLRLALREGSMRRAMDGDGQHPPSELRKLLAAMQAPLAPTSWWAVATCTARDSSPPCPAGWAAAGWAGCSVGDSSKNHRPDFRLSRIRTPRAQALQLVIPA